MREATRYVMRHRDMLAAPYDVALEFRLHTPRKHGAWPTGADLDKLVRAVLDGLVQGGAISDDRHVTALTASKAFAPEAECGVRVSVRRAA